MMNSFKFILPSQPTYSLSLFVSSFFLSFSLKDWSLCERFWRGFIFFIFSIFSFAFLEFEAWEEAQEFLQEATSKCIELNSELPSLFSGFGMISSTTKSLEFHLWIGLILGAKEGFNWGFHLKFKLSKEILVN